MQHLAVKAAEALLLRELPARKHQLFKLASALSETEMIPVLNASDAGSTQLSFLQDENNVSPNVTLHLALLK